MSRDNLGSIVQVSGSNSESPPRDILRLVANTLPDGEDLPPRRKPASVTNLLTEQDEIPEQLISAKELARHLQVPVSWCWRAARQGMLPHYRLGSYIRFSLPEVLERALRSGKGANHEGSGDNDEERE